MSGRYLRLTIPFLSGEGDMYLLIVDRETERLRRLVRSWYNPGPKHRKLSPGIILEKLGGNALLLSSDEESSKLLHWLKGREQADVRVFKVTEMTWKDIGEDVRATASSEPY